MRALFFLLLASTPAFSELISFGARGGVPLTDAFKIAEPATYSSDSGRYTIGPMVELHLPLGISIEFDALYRPLKYGSVSEGEAQVQTRGNSWQFPLLLKYRFSGGLLRSYLGAGFAFQRLSGLKQVTRILTTQPSPQSSGPAELSDRSSSGVVLAGGLELGVPFARISPELRYTRWGSKNFRSAVGGFGSQLNQAEFLVGISF
jgi:hypothetical protein